MKRGCLMIHGLAGNPNDIAPLKKFLEENLNRHIKTVTLQGHEKKSRFRYTTRIDWLRDCIRCYDDLSKYCDQIDVIGFSMGSLLAIRLSLVRSVRRIILLSPALQLPSLQQVCLIGKQLIQQKLVSYLTFQMFRNRVKNIQFQMLLQLKRLQQETEDLLPFLHQPIFILIGKYDEVTSVKKVKAFYKQLRNDKKQLFILQDSAHFICHDEDHTYLERLVLTFLK